MAVRVVAAPGGHAPVDANGRRCCGPGIATDGSDSSSTPARIAATNYSPTGSKQQVEDPKSLTGRSGTDLVPGRISEDLRRVHYIALPVNLLVSAHPDYLMLHRSIPHSATHATVDCSW